MLTQKQHHEKKRKKTQQKQIIKTKTKELSYG